MKSNKIQPQFIKKYNPRIGLIALYTLTVLPIVIWIMRDQFGSIPVELEEAVKYAE